MDYLDAWTTRGRRRTKGRKLLACSLVYIQGCEPHQVILETRDEYLALFVAGTESCSHPSDQGKDI